VLTGMAFAGPITAWAASRVDSEQSFPAIMRFGIVPMFLFAGAFYPVSELPGWLQVLARCTPLYHGVELCRGSVLHTLGVAAAAVHVAVLLAFWLCGLCVSRVVFARRLAQ
jgi:lipooligosaccharide transport system permease protein